MNKQQKFWKNEYSKEYIERNSNFDLNLGIKAWSKMLRNISDIENLLECGSNIGRNIEFLENLLPDTEKSIIELSPDAFKIVTSRYKFKEAVNSSILDSDLPSNNYDLVFTTGVLIHIHPDDLLDNLTKIYNFSKKYILFGEMFSRNPSFVNYKGEDDLLFTRDFGRYFLEHFNVDIVDYGFLWGHYFDIAGFDDCNFWVFKKKD